MKGELGLPPSVRSDPKAAELIRAWAAHGGLHCSLNPEAWPDDKAEIGWGILLSDVARHIADAYQRTKGWDKEHTITEIRKVFNAELDAPTAEASGNFV